MTEDKSGAEPAGSRRALTLATISFTVCFYAWALLGPLGPDLQDQLGLSRLSAGADDLDPGRARVADADPARACSPIGTAGAGSSRR